MCLGKPTGYHTSSHYSQVCVWRIGLLVPWSLGPVHASLRLSVYLIHPTVPSRRGGEHQVFFSSFPHLFSRSIRTYPNLHFISPSLSRPRCPFPRYLRVVPGQCSLVPEPRLGSREASLAQITTVSHIFPLPQPHHTRSFFVHRVSLLWSSYPSLVSRLNLESQPSTSKLDS